MRPRRRDAVDVAARESARLARVYAPRESLRASRESRGRVATVSVPRSFFNVVPTRYDVTRRPFAAFQTLHHVHSVIYPLDTAPEARFAYDISPMAVVVERRPHRWYSLVTSLLALVGGSFAFFRMASQAGAYAPARGRGAL